MARRIFHIEPTDAQWVVIDFLHNPAIQIHTDSINNESGILRVTEIVDDVVSVFTIDPDGYVIAQEVLNGCDDGWTAYDEEGEVNEHFYEYLAAPECFVTHVELVEITTSKKDGDGGGAVHAQATVPTAVTLHTRRFIQDLAITALAEVVDTPTITDPEKWIVTTEGRDFQLNYRVVEKPKVPTTMSAAPVSHTDVLTNELINS